MKPEKQQPSLGPKTLIGIMESKIHSVCIYIINSSFLKRSFVTY